MAEHDQVTWFPNGVRHEVDNVVQTLTKIQQQSPNARFHLFLETDLESVDQLKRGETRILFSPTISFSGSTLERQAKAEELVSALRSLSVMATAMTNYCNIQVPTRRRVNAPPNDDNHPVSPPKHNGDEGNEIKIPEWFPGHAYTKDTIKDDEMWRTMREEKLQINAEFASRFETLYPKVVRELYRSFFKNLHFAVRKRDPALLTNRLEYARFTPPWMRKQLSVRDRPVCYFSSLDSPEISITDVRAQRNALGHQRMAWLLAAFYEFEPQMSRTLLDKLMIEVTQENVSTGRGSPNSRAKRRQFHQARNRLKKRKELSPPLSSQEAASVPPKNNREREREETEPRPEGSVIFNGHEIVCALGLSCRFRDHEGGQDPERITAKCRKCQVAKMHDLCAGGEDGDRICPRCKPSKS